MTAVTPVILVVAPLRLQYIVSCKVKENEGKICVDSFLKRFCYKSSFHASVLQSFKSSGPKFSQLSILILHLCTVKILLRILCPKFKLGESVDHRLYILRLMDFD